MPGGEHGLLSAVRALVTLVAIAFFALWACNVSGNECETGSDCASGYCWRAPYTQWGDGPPGVCCATACADACESCATGTCEPARTFCPGSNGTLCAGLCDGVHPSCTYPDSSIQCSSPSCASGTNTATLASFCNGAGACAVAETQACSLGCGATECTGGCSSGSACPANTHCHAGACVENVAAGAPCAMNGECASGSCVDGVCCGSTCAGQCEACNMPGHAGTCVPVTGAPRGSRLPCTGGFPASSPNAAVCEGSCDGTNASACTYPGAETTCPNGDVCGLEVNGGFSGIVEGDAGRGNCACQTGATDVCDGMGSCFAPVSIRCVHPDGGFEAGSSGTGSGSSAGVDAGTDAGTDAGADSGASTSTTSASGLCALQPEGCPAEAGAATTSGRRSASGTSHDQLAGGGCDCRAAGDTTSDTSGRAWLVAVAAGGLLLRSRARPRTTIGARRFRLGPDT